MTDQSRGGRGTSSRTRAIGSVLKETASDWMQDNAMRLSAALSLYTLLSLAPLLVISIKVVSVVAGTKDAAKTQIIQQVQSLMGPQSAEAVKPMIENGGKHGTGVVATIVSTILLVFSATGVFVELQDSMNTIWGVKPRPNQGIMNFIRTRLLSVGMVFGVGFLLLVSMILSTVLASLAKYLGGDVKWLTILIDVGVSFAVVFLLFAGIFKFLPDVKLAWEHVWSGALLTAVLFTLGKYGLTLYFKYGTPTSAFGAAGSLAAVLLWVYYSAFILFFGAEFTKVWSLRKDGKIVPDDHAVQVTEEDRARTGIPTDKRMQKAVSDRPERTGTRTGGPTDLHDGRDNGISSAPRLTAAGYVLGAAGLALGVVVGRTRKTLPPTAVADNVNDRLQAVEAKITRVARAIHAQRS
jgi:membrane protein